MNFEDKRVKEDKPLSYQFMKKYMRVDDNEILEGSYGVNLEKIHWFTWQQNRMEIGIPNRYHIKITIQRKFALNILVCVLLVFVYVAKGETRPVRVAFPGQTMLVTFQVAQEKGYYQQEGLEVEFIFMRDTVANQALMGGNVEFATTGGSSLTAILAGAPLRIVFNSFHRPTWGLYVKPDIREIKELKGKKVGIPGGIGGAPDQNLRAVLKSHGLEGGRDVVIVGMGGSSTVYSAFLSGSVDAAVLSLVLGVRAEEAGFRQVVSFAHEDFDLAAYSGSIVVREEVLKSDVSLVEKFVRATLKGLLYARTNRSGAISIWSRYNKIREDIGEKIYTALLPAMTADGSTNARSQKRVVEEYLGLVGLKDPPPLERVFSYSVLRKVRDELETKGWQPAP